MPEGRPPFAGPTTPTVVPQHLTAPPPLVTRLRPAVPAALARLIERALAKTPADRLATAGQFAEALAAAGAAGPRSGAPGEGRPPRGDAARAGAGGGAAVWR